MTIKRKTKKSVVGSYLLAVLFVLTVCVNPVSAQLKIYVITDIEGISGVFKSRCWLQGREPLRKLYIFLPGQENKVQEILTVK